MPISSINRQFNLKNSKLVLLKQLRQFGLNPKDWTLVSDSENRSEKTTTFSICHVVTPNLKLLGLARLQSNKSYWISIELESLVA